MQQNELRKKYLQVYLGIAEISAFFDIVMAVLRYNDGKEYPTDISPVANILYDKIDKLRCNSDYFMWELHERKLI